MGPQGGGIPARRRGQPPALDRQTSTVAPMTGAKKEERREKSAESCQGAHGVTRPTSPLSPLPSPLSRRGQGRFLTTALALLFIGPLSSLRCAETNEQQQLIRLLMSDASAQAKD